MRQFVSNRVFGIGALAIPAILATIAAAALWPTQARHEPSTTGAIAEYPSEELSSGLPLPRFVSLKTGRVNVRRGPSRTHPIAFQFQRTALPVEIIREFENWRLIRDAEGEEGWVFHSLLSGTRTAMVAPWDRSDRMRDLHSNPLSDADVEARIEPQVVVAVRSCDGVWCAIEADGHKGYLEQSELWGVYPDEQFD